MEKSLRDSILEVPDLPTEKVEIPEWGTALFVRGMTAEERDKFEGVLFKDGKRDFSNLRSKLVVLTVVDEFGKRVFKDEDADLLGKKNSTAITKLFTVAQKLSGIGTSDIEALSKNS